MDLNLVWAAIAGAVLGSLADWLFAGVIFHERYQVYPEVWRQGNERGRIAAEDHRLLDGPLGLAGHRCLASLFFCAGADIGRARREALLDAARAVIEPHALARTAGATAPGPQVVVVRVLAPLVEPALQLLKAVRRAWRPLLWELPPDEPRGWTV